MRAGIAEGFAAAFKTANQESYKATLDTLYASGDFNRKPIYTVPVLIAAFLLGFSIQYLALYLLRARGFLLDVDLIVLPKKLTEVDFANLSKPSDQPKSRGILLPCWLLFLLMALVPLTGCDDEVAKAENEAYKAAYAPAYQEGRETGEPRGKFQGELVGAAAAHKVAETGEAWQLYYLLSLWTLAAGLMFGVLIQYSILLNCRLSGRLRQLPTVLFVPAMKSSLAYSIFDNSRRLTVEMDAALLKINTARQLTDEQITLARENALRKIKALQTIDAFSKTHLRALFEEELSKIVLSSTEKACRVQGNETTG